jgi:hypothetical protein
MKKTYKKNISVAIRAKKPTLRQSVAAISFREFYSAHCLTDCLEILEEQGFHQDIAIFLLGFLGGEA